jgi:pilus assembly protein CpaF
MDYLPEMEVLALLDGGLQAGPRVARGDAASKLAFESEDLFQVREPGAEGSIGPEGEEEGGRGARRGWETEDPGSLGEKLGRALSLWGGSTAGQEPGEWAGPTPMSDESVQESQGAAHPAVASLLRYLNDPSIENVDINGCDRVFLQYRDGTKKRGGAVAASDGELVEAVRLLAASVGRHERRFDFASPFLDLRLRDGSRLSAVMGVSGRPCISVRKHRFVDIDMDKAVELGFVSATCARLLRAMVEQGCNILVAGRTNAGKTTLLRALINEIPPGERIITIEQSLELGVDLLEHRHPDCVALEERTANSEGVGAVTMADLVRRSLRMNPDRVIVGETLGPEIVPLLNAMSQGKGAMATIHSSTPQGVFTRIATYAAQARERLSLEAANLLTASAVDFVVFVAIERQGGGAGPTRYVKAIREVVGADSSRVYSSEIYRGEPGGSGEMVGALSHEREPLLETAGLGA